MWFPDSVKERLGRDRIINRFLGLQWTVRKDHFGSQCIPVALQETLLLMGIFGLVAWGHRSHQDEGAPSVEKNCQDGDRPPARSAR